MFNFNIIDLLLNFVALFTAISFHEFSHGYVAYKLGDPTAKSMGRLTLNPMAHFDPIGALMMVFFRFGWAKPVPVNPYYFKDPKRDMALVAFAGPVANVILAFIFATLNALIIAFFPLQAIMYGTAIYIVIEFLSVCIMMNVYFAIFNLIPFPPLDGSKILFSVLPSDVYNRILTYEKYGTIGLIVLSVTGILGMAIKTVAFPALSVFGLWENFLISIIRGIL